MKKLVFILPLIVALMSIAGCNSTETYAEQRDRENSAIGQFLVDSAINVISEAQFKSQGYTTNVAANEYVLFSNTGVYMQIVNKGCGEAIKNGEVVTVLCRYSEKNILTDSLISSNNVLLYSSIVDKMSVINTSGTFTASFVSGSSVMASRYGTSVPPGWLTPLSYVNIGRQTNEGDELAKVKIIVPSPQGQAHASANVYPCYYVISYERGL